MTWPEGYRANPLSPTLGCRRVCILVVAEDPCEAHAQVGGGEDPMLAQAPARGTEPPTPSVRTTVRSVRSNHNFTGAKCP
eukprot:1449029-Pleurochrysis_carterae.AAC.2